MGTRNLPERTARHLTLTGLVTQRRGFPNRRKAACCPYKVKPGEPVLVFRQDGHIYVFHSRCLMEFLRDLPPDPRDVQSQYDKIRDKIIKEHVRPE